MAQLLLEAIANTAAPAAAPSQRAKSRLGYKDQRELDALPKEIESLETEQAALLARMSSSDYHQTSAESLRADSARVGVIEQEMARKFARWEQLEELRLNSGGAA